MAKTSKKNISGETGAARHAPQAPASHDMEENFFYGDDDEDAAEAEASSASPAEDAARYIADMVAALAVMAREARLDLLNYLLDMAHVEAEMQARRSEAPDPGA